MELTVKDGWVSDERGNRASINYWGDEEAARKAINSLIDCWSMTNCSGCSDCSRCSDCSDCSRCSRCSGCSRCSDCSGCSDCSDCSRCSDCSDCSRCSGCSRCSDCSGCSRCSDCSRCSRCSGCSDMVPQKAAFEVPVIENIHQAVYAAVSQPNALNMNEWHTCDTTHCRAGWVVHLAGKGGYELEDRTSTLFAAQQIYKASGYLINPCRFYDSNEDAMADMKALAEQTAETPAPQSL